MNWVWRKWKRVTPHLKAVCAVAIIFFIYIHLCIYGEFRCHGESTLISIVEACIVFGVMVWFLRREVVSWLEYY